MEQVDTLWTEERMELLRRRWAEGATSAAIGKELGVSRNAIMGKANRLGLVGSRKPDAPKRGPREPWTPERLEAVARMLSEGVGTGRISKALGGVSKEAVDYVVRRDGLMPAPAVQAQAAAAEPDPEVIEVSSVREAIQVQMFLRRAPGEAGPGPEETLPWRVPDPAAEGPVTIMGLREGVCRWPVGDPRLPGFHFCGGEADRGRPYCVAHATLAFQAREPARRPAQWSPDRMQKARTRALAQMAERRPGRRSTKWAAVPAE